MMRRVVARARASIDYRLRSARIHALVGALRLLHGVAALRRRRLRPSKPGAPMHVVHVSPTWFDEDSYLGGGERYPTCLATAMADVTPTTLVTFGSTRRTLRHGNLSIEVFPARTASTGPTDPVSWSFVREVTRADVVHCHQYTTFVSTLAIAVAAFVRAHAFVTDLGGGGIAENLDPSYFGELVEMNLPISAFSGSMLDLGRPALVIGGGVPDDALAPVPERARDTVLFVGRLLPHKGIADLIDAVDGETTIVIIGRTYDERHLADLRALAQGKRVRFVLDADDGVVLDAYRSAVVTVLPSVYVDRDGTHHETPELLGLTLLESMACGTPVICTDVGGMPEYVDDGVTGFVVPPNDPAALRERIDFLRANPERARDMGERAREHALREHTWARVAERCLSAYRQTGNGTTDRPE